ncbi:MAG: ketoacyl-ACP synthase III [Caldisericia bacterium]|nr:ketoacyl-ACP synthase III [Caldisericia bacterium]
MSVSNINNIAIEGIASCVPSHEVNNYETKNNIYGDSLEGLIRATGVEKRRVFEHHSATTKDISVKAAEKLFKYGSFSKQDFGAIVFVTSSPDNIMPNNSTHVQYLMNFPKNIACFDINHACAGYPYGLWTSALIANNIQQKVLLLVGDTNSYFASPKDKATSILFGDAGTATIVAPKNNPNEWHFMFNTDGSNRESLIIPDFGFRNELTEKSLQYVKYEDGSQRRGIDMKMEGIDIFSYVVQTVPKIIDEFFDQVNIPKDAIDFFSFHQANAYMIKQLARKLKIDMKKIPISIGKYGNTSAASIPLNICSEMKNEIENKQCSTLIAGFGAGLATSVGIINFDHCFCPGVIDYCE